MTGAGKSTLIQMLMEHPWVPGERPSLKEAGVTPPVVGKRGDSNPTSGDVHLYLDPVPETPLFYADCEGFHGGESDPAGSKARISALEGSRPEPPAAPEIEERYDVFRASLEFLRRGISRVLRLPSRFPTSSRQSAVTEVFPRLLYNFSDVVVHVIRDHAVRAIEGDILRLLEWAQTSAAAATNRGTLPHLIIALNAAEDDSIWDPEAAKANIFYDHKDMLKDNPAVRQQKEKFEKLGQKIEGIEDLLRCSYASVKCIRIPNGANTPRLSAQLSLLYSLIDAASTEAQAKKKDANLLLSSEDQELLFKLAFNHYTTDLDAPFDFLEQLLSLHPLPSSFKNNLAKVMIEASRALNYGLRTEFFTLQIFPVLASAIALNMARSNRRLPGTLISIFNGNSTTTKKESTRENSYRYQVQQAVDLFCSLYCHCEYTHQDGRRCTNNRASHNSVNQHQDKNGKILGFGSFQSPFVDDLLEKWGKRIKGQLITIDTYLEEKNINEETIRDIDRAKLDILWACHFEHLRALFHDLPKHGTTDLFTCFWCLREFPVDILPCGHAICASCARVMGAQDGGSEDSDSDSRVIWIYGCTLHPEFLDFKPFHAIYLKPKSAGYRILALDGGGVRGIIELTILDAIEERLGGKIPIQRFFDLIGGTSAGGHIAIGLGIKNWGVRLFLRIFKSICSSAFLEPKDWLSTFWAGYRYNSFLWNKQLREVLGNTAFKAMIEAKASVLNIPELCS
jgi:hypothetical protein